MDDKSQEPRDEAVGDALAALHGRLVEEGSNTSLSLAGLDADELVRVLRMQDCLVQLERLRTADAADDSQISGASVKAASHNAGDGSTAQPARNSTLPSVDAVGQAPDATIGFSESEDDRASIAEISLPATGADGSTARGPARIGRFEIVRALGRGGQGLMLLANDPVLSRQVALKVPWSETLITPVLRRRFLREAQAVARLTHPHIVAVYEVGEVGPICFIASAFVAGPSLAAWLKERGALPSPQEAAPLERFHFRCGGIRSAENSFDTLVR